MRRYTWDVGFWAWLLMRISGCLIVLFLLMHLGVLSLLGKGKESFEAFIAITDHPIMKLMELGVVGCLLFHGLNGIRVILFDLGIGLHVQKKLFWGVVVVGMVLFVLAAVPIVTKL
jgi:succinate dehydrogenase / fumarate reductase cytochrome b subunit